MFWKFWVHYKPQKYSWDSRLCWLLFVGLWMDGQQNKGKDTLVFRLEGMMRWTDILQCPSLYQLRKNEESLTTLCLPLGGLQNANPQEKGMQKLMLPPCYTEVKREPSNDSLHFHVHYLNTSHKLRGIKCENKGKILELLITFLCW